jgi:hypothetical protein
MFAGRPTRQHGCAGGFNRDHAHCGFARLEHLANSSDCSARADGADEDIHSALGVVPNLNGRSSPMQIGVRAVPELVQHDCTRGLCDEICSPRDSIDHENAGRKHNFCTEVSQQRDSFFDIVSGIVRTSR